MEHSKTVTFLKKILEQYHLKFHFIFESASSFEHIDKGIRRYWGLNDLYEVAADLMQLKLSPNTVYAISDDFFSNYFMMEIPSKGERCFLVIGPYTEHNFTQTELVVLTQKHQLPNPVKESMLQYYMTLPFIADSSHIRIILTSFYESVWELHEPCMLKEVQHYLTKQYEDVPPAALLENFSESVDFSFKMKLIEERYQIEASLVKYISQGNHDKALSTLAGLNTAFMENRAETPLRDFKNYGIVLNTLARKGAELGLVHPIHIDKLSSHFARKIESLTSLDHGKTLFLEIIRKYCLLVKNHSLKDYSLLVQKVVTRIDSDLSADLSLSTHADLLNVHPSYLSTLFRKETGVTLTEYVNQKRIEYGIFLLNTTDLQIQVIAQQCGVPDINYFTRIFKKQIGQTPSEYKKTLHASI